MANNLSTYACRVCGFLHPFQPWGEDGQSPTFDYCLCCGVEFGYQDCNILAIKSYREKWIKEGTPWDEPDKKIEHWDLEKQMKNIPKEYK